MTGDTLGKSLVNEALTLFMHDRAESSLLASCGRYNGENTKQAGGTATPQSSMSNRHQQLGHMTTHFLNI
jgi:hypothetical protein